MSAFLIAPMSPTHTHTHTNAQAYMLTHTYIHTHRCTGVYSHAHLHTHTHTLIKKKCEGSRPEWCISSMLYSRDTPLWSETLNMHVHKHTHTHMHTHEVHIRLLSYFMNLDLVNHPFSFITTENMTPTWLTPLNPLSFFLHSPSADLLLFPFVSQQTLNRLGHWVWHHFPLHCTMS